MIGSKNVKGFYGVVLGDFMITSDDHLLLLSLEATSLFQSLFGGVDPFEDFLDSASQGARASGVLFVFGMLFGQPVENDWFQISKVF